MAEGGDLDPTELNPFDPRGEDGGDREDENIPMTSTSRHRETPFGRPRRRGGREQETPFGGNDERTPLLSIDGDMDEFMEERREKSDEALRIIENMFPEFDKEKSPFRATLDSSNNVLVTIDSDYKGGKFKGKPHRLFDKKGELNKKLPKTITKSLGPIAEDVIETNEVSISEHVNRAFELEDERENTVGEARKRLGDQIEEERQSIDQLEQENEAILERMPLRERVKSIFKKYGLTVVGVMTAVGTVIGVIVSNLKSGLNKVAKGVGNGLKTLGKKIAEILPGMIRAIANFLLKAAGEAVGFLVKNAWLLIVAVVIYFIDNFVGKKRRSKRKE